MINFSSLHLLIAGFVASAAVLSTVATVLPSLADEKSNGTKVSLQRLTEAIRKNPKSAQAYLNRANFERQCWDNDKAIIDYNAALQLDPKMGRIYLERGRGYSEIEQFDKAIRDLAEARKDPRTAVEALDELAKLHYVMHDFAPAAAEYQELLKKSPLNQSRNFGLLSECLIKSDQLQKALDVSKDAVKSYPWSWQIHLERGKILLAAKRVKEALVDLNECIRLKSDNNEAYLLRAKAYDLLGDKERSANDRLISQQFQKTELQEYPFRVH
jgi:tetratricopeptide (TPR) repeat protein